MFEWIYRNNFAWLVVDHLTFVSFPPLSSKFISTESESLSSPSEGIEIDDITNIHVIYDSQQPLDTSKTRHADLLDS